MAEPATPDLPLIMVSYHDSDVHWADKLVMLLLSSSDGRYGLCKERVSSAGAKLEGMPTFTLDLVRVVVILISPKYIESVTRHGVLAWEPRTTHDVFWLLVQDTPKEDLKQVPSRYLSMNATPLANVDAETANVILGKVADVAGVFAGDVLKSRPAEPQQNEQFPTVASVARYPRSDEAESTLSLARQLATTCKPPVVTTAALLFGMAEAGRAGSDYFRTTNFLWEELSARGEDVYTRALMEEFPALVNLGERAGRNIGSIPREAELISPNLIKVFDLAHEILLHTTRPRPQESHLDVRHLLAALLVLNPDDGPTGASRRLAAIVGDVTAMRKRFYNFIVKTVPDDNHEAWRPILINLKLPDIQPPELTQAEPQREQTPPQPAVAGFMADDWHGRDLLGIERDVNALASLVAAYKVEPPLSIGLFGDWGSGKSHFMRQMRKRVELLSQKARESGKPQNELGYYKNIVQIEFNAWHYIEGNLWASLVDHIFANLKLSEKEPRSFAEERRDELMQRLGVKEEFQDKINSKVQECEDELRRLNERKERAEAELEHASTQLDGFREEVKASLKTLTVPVSFTEEEKQLLGRLGIETGSAITAADVHRNYLKLKDRWNGLKAKWKLFRSDERVGRRYLLSALLVVIAIGAPALLKLGVVPRLPTVVVSVLGFVATLLAAAKPAWEQFQVSLKALEKHDLKVERERQKRITELENEVSALTKEVVAAKLESEIVGKEIEKLKVDIASTSSSRILAEFIEDRAGASDYRRHLGLVALIRRDFEKLRDLFEQQRKEEEEGTEVEDKTKINRIVLYIDDLDRCQPKRVVEVLQAIHLLLAFPLFVVVVGVDSRWITRSLQQSYEWLREVNEEPSNGEKTNGTAERDEHRSLKNGATPHDYLEKIFQIPFWLRPMNDDACITFLDGLTKDATDKPLPPAKDETAAVTQRWSPATREAHSAAASMVQPARSSADNTSRNASLENLAAPVVRRPFFAPAPREYTPPIDLAPRSLTFSTYEIDYMKKLVPLIGRSPRAVKRFLNCYRLIKVGLTPTEFEQFIGEKGESQGYQAVMFLLGVITGTPTVSAYVVEELKSWHEREFNLESFVRVLSSNVQMRQQPDAERLLRFLESYDFGKTANLLFQEVVNYAPRVSRFSFRVNRADAAK